MPQGSPKNELPLLSLPQIARRPVPPNIARALAADKKTRSARIAKSPYLSTDDLLNRSLIDGTLLPPVRSPNTARSSSRSERSTTPRKDDQASPPHQEPQPSSPPQQDRTPSDATPSASPSRRSELNELTVTYLRVLQRSEDYNRRAIMQDRAKSMKHAETPWNRLNEYILQQLANFAAVRYGEQTQRKSIQDDEIRGFTNIEKLAEQSRATAKRHEDVRPTCPLINKNQKVLLDPSCAIGLTIELRWRGGSHLNPVIFVYDDADKLLALGSQSEIVRGPEGTVAIRYIPSLVGAATIGTGGARSCFHVSLATLPARSSKVVICGFADRHATSLRDLSRTWLTLYEPGATPSQVTRELYACGSLDGGALTGVIVASLTRRQGDVWMFNCINEAILGGIPPAKMGTIIPLDFKPDRSTFFAEHFAFSRERLLGGYFSWIEEWGRKAVIMHEAAVRTEILTLQKFEHAAALKRAQQSRYYRAFMRPSNASSH